MSHTAAGTTTPMTMTRRGRMVISTVVASAVIAVGLLFAGPGAQAGGEAGTDAPVYTVLAGETLWSIATELAPRQDPRITIDQLMRANNLRTAEIRPGDVLLLPSGF
jgi:hypothetical protein